MAEEQINAEQAQALFAESFAKVTGKEYSSTRVEETPAATTVAATEPPAEAAKEVVTPVEKKEPAATPPAAEEKKEEKKEPAASKAPEKDADPYAWVKELPDSVKGKVLQEINDKIALDHYKKSNEGRIAAYQRQLLEAERFIAQNKPTNEGSPAPADRSVKTPEEWTKLANDDPEIAKAVEARVKSEVDAAVSSIESKLQGLQKSGDVLYQHEQRQYVERERQALQAIVPNYAEVIGSKEFQHWRDNEASPGLKQMSLTSLHHLDAVNVLRAYADDMIRTGRATPRQEEHVPTEPATTKQPETPAADPAKAEADRIAAERDARSKQSTVVTAPAQTFAGAGAGGVQFKAGSSELEEAFQKAWAKVNPKKT